MLTALHARVLRIYIQGILVFFKISVNDTKFSGTRDTYVLMSIISIKNSVR